MYIDLGKTLKAIHKCLPEEGAPSIKQLHRIHALTIQLMSQVLAAVYDMECFERPFHMNRPRLAETQSQGDNHGGAVILTISEPLPSMKRLTEALEEHWKAMLHAAISKAAQQGPLPRFEKAMVEIEIVTPRGSNNAQVWDSSNRAIQIILNNLKGIFFYDDDMEHMAFSVAGRWGEEGVTIIRISPFNG